jgi:hypothetical protein
MNAIYQTKQLNLYPMSRLFTDELHALHVNDTVMASVGGTDNKDVSLNKIQ